MQYLRNTNQIQTVGLNKPIGGRESCYYGFVTNSSFIGNTLNIPTTPGSILWKWFACDNPTETNLLLGCGGPSQCNPPGGPAFASIGCMSSTRFTIPPDLGPGSGRPNVLLFSPFTCETEFTQSMTNYEYVTFTSLAFGDPYITGSVPPVVVNNTVYPWALASYIPSGSTEYEYKVIQLIPNDNYPAPTAFYAPGTPLWGPIAIVSGSAYYSVSYQSPKGDEPENPTSQNMYFTPYP
jgi:hypothetical protein